MEFHKVSKNQELKDILGEKDNSIKELKGTVEVSVWVGRFWS